MHVTVVGAGIVGACTAVALAKRGIAVSLIERSAPAAGCSFGNAGALSPGSCVPLSVPGQWKKIPGWLIHPDGPLRVSPSAFIGQAPWFLRFLLAGRAQAAKHSAHALSQLMRSTFDNYRKLTAGSNAFELIQRDGSLYLYRSEQELRADAYGWALRQDHGVAFREVDAEYIAAKVPALSRKFKKGVLLPDHGHCINPGGLVQRLVDLAITLGVELIADDVRHIVVSGRRVTRLVCALNEYPVETLVVTAGVDSVSLARQLGIRIPLARERGYHLTFQDPGVDLPMPVMVAGGKFFITPMEMGIRVAGTSEFTAASAPPNAQRIGALMRQAAEALPGLNTATFTQWMGERPSLPDSLPVISPVPGVASAYLAFGHGHLGLSAASTTAYMVAAMICGEVPPPLDPAPFSARRFNRR